MKRNSPTALFAIIIVTVILAITLVVFFMVFEPYKTIRRTGAGDEANANFYLATDRWFSAEGHPVRVLEHGAVKTLAAAPEQTAQLYSSSFNWTDSGQLMALIENGLKLVIFIDDMGNSPLDRFLEDAGISCHIFTSVDEDEDEDEYKDTPGVNDDFDKDNAGKLTAGNDASWDSELYLTVDEPELWQLMSDSNGRIRLAGRALGRGELWVSGIPYFMRWQHLLMKDSVFELSAGSAEEKERNSLRENARLSWKLGGGLDRERSGILIVRNAVSSGAKWHDDALKGFWERLFENQRAIILLLSLGMAVITGFWMTFPSFGVLRPDPALPGKPIRERFKTEGEFFRAHRCLYIYLEPRAAALRAALLKQGIADFELEDFLKREYHLDTKTAATLLNPSGIRTVQELTRYRALAAKILSGRHGIAVSRKF